MIDDLSDRRTAMAAAKATLSAGGAAEAPDAVDPAVLASWRRCAPALRPDGAGSAPVEPADEARSRWETSPLSRAAPDLPAHLRAIAETSDLVACVTDAEGRVLVQAAPRRLNRRAEDIGLVQGGIWHESVAGTNGIGLALAVARPVAVFATEHWLDALHEWVCYSAPVHDADGRLVAVVDLSTTWRHANPLALPMVASLARNLEHELRAFGPLPASRPALQLRLLGSPSARLGDRPLRLTLRQFEILAVLCLAGPVTLGELHAHLYGDRPVTMTTLKAEISRLRRELRGQLTSRPYRLTVDWEADVTRLLARLDQGDVEGATRLYDGQLLPSSTSPFVEEHRHHVDVALRTAVLQRPSSSVALRYNAVHPYDVEVLERARSAVPDDDPLVPALTGRLAAAEL